MERAAGRPDFVAAGAVVLMAGIWGYNWVALKLITPDVSPFILSAMRVVTASIVLSATAILLRRPLTSPPPLQTFTAGMTQNGLFIILQNFALLAVRSKAAEHFNSHWVIEHALPKNFEVLLREHGGGR